MSFDLTEIKDQANAALKGNNVEEARGVYMAAIMDVGDCMMSMQEDENDSAAIAAPVATKVNAPMRKWAVAGDLVLKRAANECPAKRRGAMYVKLRPSALPPRHADVAKPKRNAA